MINNKLLTTRIKLIVRLIRLEGSLNFRNTRRLSVFLRKYRRIINEKCFFRTKHGCQDSGKPGKPGKVREK